MQKLTANGVCRPTPRLKTRKTQIYSIIGSVTLDFAKINFEYASMYFHIERNTKKAAQIGCLGQNGLIYAYL